MWDQSALACPTVPRGECAPPIVGYLYYRIQDVKAVIHDATFVCETKVACNFNMFIVNSFHIKVILV